MTTTSHTETDMTSDPTAAGSVGLSRVQRLEAHTLFQPRTFTRDEREALNNAFQLNRMEMTPDDIMAVEDCLDAMKAAKLTTYSAYMTVNAPRLRLAELKRLGIDGLDFPPSIRARFHILCEAQALNRAIAWAVEVTTSDAPARKALQTSVFVQAWEQETGEKVDAALPLMAVKGWMVPDYNAMCFVDKDIFDQVRDVFKHRIVKPT